MQKPPWPGRSVIWPEDQITEACVRQEWTYSILLWTVLGLGKKPYIYIFPPFSVQGAPGFWTLLCVSPLSLSLLVKFLSCLRLWCSSLLFLRVFWEQEPFSESMDSPMTSCTHDIWNYLIGSNFNFSMQVLHSVSLYCFYFESQNRPMIYLQGWRLLKVCQYLPLTHKSL
jgi:hypothetical protein